MYKIQEYLSRNKRDNLKQNFFDHLLSSKREILAGAIRYSARGVKNTIKIRSWSILDRIAHIVGLRARRCPGILQSIRIGYWSLSEMINWSFLSTSAFTNVPEHQDSSVRSDRKSNVCTFVRLSFSFSLSLSSVVGTFYVSCSEVRPGSRPWTLDFAYWLCSPWLQQPTERVRISQRGARCHRGVAAGNVCVLMLSILVLSIIRPGRCSITVPTDTARERKRSIVAS